MGPTSDYNHGHLAKAGYFSMNEDHFYTYYWENCIVQDSNLNRALWNRIENVIQSFAMNTQNNLRVISGALYDDGKSIPYAFYSIVRQVYHLEGIVFKGKYLMRMGAFGKFIVEFRHF